MKQYKRNADIQSLETAQGCSHFATLIKTADKTRRAYKYTFMPIQSLILYLVQRVRVCNMLCQPTVTSLPKPKHINNNLLLNIVGILTLAWFISKFSNYIFQFRKIHFIIDCVEFNLTTDALAVVSHRC